jgi:hypothetical protein
MPRHRPKRSIASAVYAEHDGMKRQGEGEPDLSAWYARIIPRAARCAPLRRADASPASAADGPRT